LLHTSDWHLGRAFHRVNMLGAQSEFIGHLVSTARERDVDAVVVSGDVYDRAVPPLAAVELFDAWLVDDGFRLASPRDPVRRGAQITLHHPKAWQICQALKDADVIPDFRTPDRLRLGFAPLYTRFVDVYEGLRRLREVMTSHAYDGYSAHRGRVT